MTELAVTTVVGLGGFAVGLVFGATVQRTNFCTMGGISDFVIMGDGRRFRAWLLAIAVAVIGGIAFSGGEGNILGLILGGIVMAVVGNCVNLLGLPARFQDFFIGFVIILVVLIDHVTQKRGKVAM